MALTMHIKLTDVRQITHQHQKAVDTILLVSATMPSLHLLTTLYGWQISPANYWDTRHCIPYYGGINELTRNASILVDGKPVSALLSVRLSFQETIEGKRKKINYT